MAIRRGHAGRTDSNHVEIVAALRKAGICATSTASVGKGFPDVVAGYRSISVLLEVKDGERPCDRKLTVDEQSFHDSWAGSLHIVSTPEEAIVTVISEAKRLGVL